ncbi:MAG: hypothetical protein GXP31_08725 [Kiritimatiellaeota bacterium]|nr:hypothetical protein [Kiritimatiellota bacterium]
MTSRERLLAAARHEKVDRVPVAPFGLGRLPPGGAVTRELISRTDPFLTCGIGNPFLGKAARAESVQDGNMTVTTWHTPLGDLVHKRAHTDITSATVEFPLKTVCDIEKLLSIPFEPAEPNPPAFLALKNELGQEGVALAGIGTAVCLPAAWFSPEDFCLLWADAPDAMKQLVDVAAERLNDFVLKACRAGVADYRLVGGEYVTVQLGPSAVPDLLRGPDAELVEIIHRHGGIAYYHNHGPCMGFLDDFAGLGIDYLDPLEAPPWGDADLAKAAAALRSRVCMVGNLDDMEVIERLSEAEVKAIATERLEAAGTRGFVLGGTASGTYTEPAARNFIAMVDVAENFGWHD